MGARLVRSIPKLLVSTAAFVAFALVNPLLLMGCGPRCGAGSHDRDYSDERARAAMEEYGVEEHIYTAHNANGTVTFTIGVNEARIAGVRGTLFPSKPDWIRAAQACSYTRTGRVEVSGVVSAVFESNDGASEDLFASREFTGEYVERTDGHSLPSNLVYDDPEGLSFRLTSERGRVDEFELESLELPSHPESKIN